MAVQTQLINGLYRIVDEDGEIAINTRTEKPIDGGGHKDLAKAERQAGYVNAALEKQESVNNVN